MADKEPVKAFISKQSFVAVLCIVFAIVFTASFIVNKEAALKDFASANYRMEDIFTKYGIYAGIIFAVVSWIVLGMLEGIASLVGLGKWKYVNIILSLIVFGGWLAFAVQLVFIEPRFTSIAKAIIFFTGKPLLYASGATLIIAALFVSFSKPGRE